MSLPKDPIKREMTLQKMRESAQKRCKDPEWLKQNRIQIHAKDPIWIEKQRQNALNQHLDPIKKQNYINGLKKRSQNQEWRKKISDRSKLYVGEKNPNFGNHKLAGKNNPMFGFTGNNSPCWKGGISFEPYCPKFNNNLKNRVRLFWDNKCGSCGKHQDDNNGKLSVHHVHYDKKICCNGKIVMFIPLCKQCHGKTNHNREQYERIYEQLIYDKYNGRSYYTIEEYEKL